MCVIALAALYHDEAHQLAASVQVPGQESVSRLPPVWLHLRRLPPSHGLSTFDKTMTFTQGFHHVDGMNSFDYHYVNSVES